MSDNTLLNTELFAAANQSSQPELLVAAVLHLMSHYTVNSAQGGGDHACLKLAAVIERHLKILAELPELTPVLRATCRQLSEQWAGLIERSLERPGRLLKLGRLLAGTA